MAESGESTVSMDVQIAIASEIKKAVDAYQGQLLTNMQTLMESNFKTFKLSIESTQKELSTTKISKIEENLFGTDTAMKRSTVVISK